MTTSLVVRRTLFTLAGVALLGAAGGGQKTQAADPHARHIIVKPAELQFKPGPPGLPKGAQVAVIEGDPAAPGKHFTLRAKLPAGYRIAPHTHPTDEILTVLSGEFGMGLGEKLDPAKVEKLPAGGFSMMKAGTAHYVVITKETVIQVSSTGPFEINYINPADDPRNAAPASAASTQQR